MSDDSGLVKLAEFVRDHGSEAGLGTIDVDQLPGAGESFPNKITVASIPAAGGSPAKLVSIKALVDEWRTAPDRVRGTAVLHDLESFIAHVVRFSGEGSALFADRSGPMIQAVLDYHGFVEWGGEDCKNVVKKADPAWMQHRARFVMPLSDQWKAWTANNGKKMSQGDFAAWIEDRIDDIAAPPAESAAVEGALMQRAMRMADALGSKIAGPAKLIEVARNLNVTQTARVKQAVNLSTGDVVAHYEATTEAYDGPTKVTVPTMFVVELPVFYRDASYRIAVRLRHKVQNQAAVWWYEMYRSDLVLDHAFEEACQRAHRASDLPLFMGAPEA